MSEGPPGDVRASVANAIVGIYSECYGRGPTKAKAHFLDDYVLVVLEDIFTTVERTLIESASQDLVREVRLRFQEAVAGRFKGAVEEITGRRVLAYQSQVIFEPPTGFEIFMLE